LNEQDENKFYDDSELYASIDKIAQNTNEPFLEEPWIVQSALERVERLQSNAELNSIERKKRRNDTLFIGKFLYKIFKFKESEKSSEGIIFTIFPSAIIKQVKIDFQYLTIKEKKNFNRIFYLLKCHLILK